MNVVPAKKDPETGGIQNSWAKPPYLYRMTGVQGGDMALSGYAHLYWILSLTEAGITACGKNQKPKIFRFWLNLHRRINELQSQT